MRWNPHADAGLAGDLSPRDKYLDALGAELEALQEQVRELTARLDKLAPSPAGTGAA